MLGVPMAVMVSVRRPMRRAMRVVTVCVAMVAGMVPSMCFAMVAPVLASVPMTLLMAGRAVVVVPATVSERLGADAQADRGCGEGKQGDQDLHGATPWDGACRMLWAG